MPLVPSIFYTVMKYHAYDNLSNQGLLRETESRLVISMVLERQLRPYGHVARLPDVDPAHRVYVLRGNSRYRNRLSQLHEYRESLSRDFH